VVILSSFSNLSIAKKAIFSEKNEKDFLKNRAKNEKSEKR
jgi:hypothetical protein